MALHITAILIVLIPRVFCFHAEQPSVSPNGAPVLQEGSRRGIWDTSNSFSGPQPVNVTLFCYVSLQTSVLLPSHWWLGHTSGTPLALTDSICFVNPCRWNGQPWRKIQLWFMQRHFSSDGCILSSRSNKLPKCSPSFPWVMAELSLPV